MIRAVGNKLIIELIKAQAKEEVRESGLVVFTGKGTSLSDATLEAKVLSVGEGRYHEKTGQLIAPPFKVGDKVIITVGTGLELKENVRVIDVDDVFGIME
jgi:co-chaperonin GroES (HSP10)